MPDCEVLVVGGGPTGLFLGALLARDGVDVAVLERRSGPSTHSRAIGLHPPALEALEELDVREAVVAAGVRVHTGQARSRGRLLGSLTFERAWPQNPFVLTLPQQRTEAVLEQRLADLAPGALRRDREVIEVHDAGPGPVRVLVRPTAPAGAEPETWTARVVVVAGGAHGRTRELTGITGRVRAYPDTYLMGDFADATSDPGTAAIHLEPEGVVESFPLPGGVRRWVVHTGWVPAPASAPRLTELVAERTGAVLDVASNSMVSAFAVRRRIAERMVRGRRVVLGDAAHEISPIGGQGMTLGWLDASELAPLLVRELRRATGRELDGVPELVAFQRRRLAASRRAAWQAGANTRLGRPVPAGVRGARDGLLRAVLATPARHGLAGAFSMRWAGAAQQPRRAGAARSRVPVPPAPAAGRR
ncbi:2-polyprenyl-6-methoxyphenol hydroxylase-like FAD-dependent oxidoreductase [Kineococcus radiotolerans]|uniref:2-polyprenyl-6-methoxyphenol hydroxylase-like FAD-dependent oxidoreductase n=1 Tax=Kineococcus radiotolerans TaxID=131568 RepID=A0A7W4TQW3_KINRA|nr:NAD(P)/FAD-dependent oxidoreductase [Kineococcus radiotolerans]MBB2903043.1 2-polyprenyl-6-methoxyphenol hydroxylase-like FAD-dependent oxidoreductase [Kineococcus radiotolerans]